MHYAVKGLMIKKKKTIVRKRKICQQEFYVKCKFSRLFKPWPSVISWHKKG